MAEVETEAAAKQRRRSIARCMPFVPDVLNIQDRDHLMNMLYKFGILSAYLTALDNADDDGLGEDGREVEFSNYFDICDDVFIKINPDTGRITQLHLFKPNFYFDDDENFVHESFPIDVPPIIGQIQNLESISLEVCQSLTKELGNLPFLREIGLYTCSNDMFANIPKGLQLPHIKKVKIVSSNFDSNLSSFLKIFPKTLEELYFHHTTKDQVKEVLRVLQNDDLCFRKSLTTITLFNCNLNGADFIRLMHTVRDWFPNLHTLDIGGNNIESVAGIHDTIESSASASASASALPTMPNYKLRKLVLVSSGGYHLNYLLNSVYGGEESAEQQQTRLWHEGKDNAIGKFFLINKDSNSNITMDPKEKTALLSLLATFQGISNLGLNLNLSLNYDPDIENVLRINHAGRKLITSTALEREDSKKTETIITPALWPVILERAFKRSDEIYFIGNLQTTQQRNKMKCATGLFDLVRYFGSKFLSNRGSINMPTTDDNASKGKHKHDEI